MARSSGRRAGFLFNDKSGYRRALHSLELCTSDWVGERIANTVVNGSDLSRLNNPAGLVEVTRP